MRLIKISRSFSSLFLAGLFSSSLRADQVVLKNGLLVDCYSWAQKWLLTWFGPVVCAAILAIDACRKGSTRSGGACLSSMA
jgi:hypothetical protein